MAYFKYLFAAEVLAGCIGIVVYLRMLRYPKFGVAKFLNEAEGVERVAPILATASKEVLIKGGELNRDFWGAYSVLEAVHAGLIRGAIFHFIFGPKLDEKDSQLLKLMAEYPRQIRLYRVRARTMPHFMVIDEKYISWESDHEMLGDRSGIVARDKVNAKKLRNMFYEEWRKAEKIEFAELLKTMSSAEFLKVQGNDTVNSENFSFVTKAATGKAVSSRPDSVIELSKELAAVGDS